MLALRDDLSRQLTPQLTLRVGFDGELRSDSIFFNFPLVPDTPPLRPHRPEDRAAARSRSTPRRRGLYADATWDVGGGVTVIPGLRGDDFRYVGQNRFTFDPRLVVRWKMSDVHTWKAGAGIYHQMVDPQLLNPQFGNPNLPPIWADQYSVGFLRRLHRRS